MNFSPNNQVHSLLEYDTVICMQVPLKHQYTPTKSQTLLQGGSNMTGTDLYVNKPHCAAAVRP